MANESVSQWAKDNCQPIHHGEGDDVCSHPDNGHTGWATVLAGAGGYIAGAVRLIPEHDGPLITPRAGQQYEADGVAIKYEDAAKKTTYVTYKVSGKSHAKLAGFDGNRPIFRGCSAGEVWVGGRGLPWLVPNDEFGGPGTDKYNGGW